MEIDLHLREIPVQKPLQLVLVHVLLMIQQMVLMEDF